VTVVANRMIMTLAFHLLRTCGDIGVPLGAEVGVRALPPSTRNCNVQAGDASNSGLTRSAQLGWPRDVRDSAGVRPKRCVTAGNCDLDTCVI